MEVLDQGPVVDTGSECSFQCDHMLSRRRRPTGGAEQKHKKQSGTTLVKKKFLSLLDSFGVAKGPSDASKSVEETFGFSSELVDPNQFRDPKPLIKQNILKTRLALVNPPLCFPLSYVQHASVDEVSSDQFKVFRKRQLAWIKSSLEEHNHREELLLRILHKRQTLFKSGVKLPSRRGTKKVLFLVF